MYNTSSGYLNQQYVREFCEKMGLNESQTAYFIYFVDMYRDNSPSAIQIDDLVRLVHSKRSMKFNEGEEQSFKNLAQAIKQAEVSLFQTFQFLDRDGSRSVTLAEMKEGIIDIKLEITSHDVETIF